MSQKQWWTGKGYGVSNITDITGRPLLTYQGPNDKNPIICSDRVAQTFDFTVKQKVDGASMKNGRMDSATAAAAKKVFGGGSDDELDHKISLELGGSNTPANLWIQHGLKAGASNQSDQLENELSLSVQAGQISLLDAWRSLSEQKGFILVEDLPAPKKQNAGALMLQLAGHLASYIAGRGKPASKPSQDVVYKQQALLADLEANPFDKNLKYQLFQTQLDTTQQQFNINKSDAQQTTNSTLAMYAYSKGIDPKQVAGDTELALSTLLGYVEHPPTLFGMPISVIDQIGAYAAVALQGVAFVGLVIAVIGIIIAGPEAIIAALSGGLFESIAGIMGVSVTAGVGISVLAIAEGASAALFVTGMFTKGIFDTGVQTTSSEIQNVKNAIDIEKSLAGFTAGAGNSGLLPNSQGAQPTTSYPLPQSSAGQNIGPFANPAEYAAALGVGVNGGGGGGGGGGSGSGGGGGTPTQIYPAVIQNGVLKPASQFTPSESQQLQTLDDVRQVAHDNLASFLLALPDSIEVHFKLEKQFLKDDGTYEFAQNKKYIKKYSKPTGAIKMTDPVTFQEVITGYKNPPKPIYKTAWNKFVIMSLVLNQSRYKQIRLADINLGPTDEPLFEPTPADLEKLAVSLRGNITTESTQTAAVMVNPTPIPQVTVAPVTPPPPTPEHVAAAISIGQTPEQLIAQGVKVSETLADAKNNLVPVKIYYSGPGKIGFPAQLIVGATPNVPNGYHEIDLADAQNIIRNTPTNLITSDSNQVNNLYTQLGINNNTQGDFYSKVLIVSGFAGTQITPGQILSGNLPDSKYVWAIKDKNGHIATYVPLDQAATLLPS